MFHSKHISVATLSACLFTAPACAATVHAEQARPAAGSATNDDVIPQMTVRGNAELQKPADQVEIRLSVVTEAEDAEDAIDANARDSEDVVDALERLDLTEDEYETGQYRVSPQYSRRPRNADIDWKPTIVGYRVTNSLLITTRRLDDAGKIIQKATEAGANSVDSVSFSLSDPLVHRSEAIREAARLAMADARVLAAATDQRIVRVLSLTLDQAYAQPIMQRGSDTVGRMAMESSAAPPITPGDITVTASVTVVLEIASQ